MLERGDDPPLHVPVGRNYPIHETGGVLEHHRTRVRPVARGGGRGHDRWRKYGGAPAREADESERDVAMHARALARTRPSPNRPKRVAEPPRRLLSHRRARD